MFAPFVFFNLLLLTIWVTIKQIEDQLTNERHHEDTEEHPEGVTEDVYHHDGEQRHGQVGLTLSLVTLSATQDLQL